jgi:hypothetical protein
VSHFNDICAYVPLIIELYVIISPVSCDIQSELSIYGLIVVSIIGGKLFFCVILVLISNVLFFRTLCSRSS